MRPRNQAANTESGKSAARAAKTNNMKHECPHCNTAHDDDFEVLIEDVLHEIRCGECSKTYYFYTAECTACLNDALFVWPTRPSEAALQQLDCEVCGQKLMPA